MIYKLDKKDISKPPLYKECYTKGPKSLNKYNNSYTKGTKSLNKYKNS